MRSIAVAALAALATLAVAAGGARADEQYAKRLFAENYAAQGKSYACFVRRYDAAHLARHRQQKVSVMKLLITAEMLPEDKTAAATSIRAATAATPSASDLSADKMHLGCAVDCDGGGISVELAHADKSTLIRLDSIRIWQDNQASDEDFDLSGGADDRVFGLDRAKLDECRALVTDRKELAAMRHK